MTDCFKDSGDKLPLKFEITHVTFVYSRTVFIYPKSARFTANGFSLHDFNNSFNMNKFLFSFPWYFEGNTWSHALFYRDK